MDRQTNAVIETDIEALAEVYQRDGLRGLIATIEARVERDPVRSSIYLVADANSVPVVGKEPASTATERTESAARLARGDLETTRRLDEGQIKGEHMTSAISSMTPATDTTQEAATTPNKDLGSKEVFLQLLVSQIKNQDPLNPMDSMNFVTQLAQFSQLEAVLGMRKDLQAVMQSTVSADQSANT
jgi:flagellar basal-body rod modification protein FlgD